MVDAVVASIGKTNETLLPLVDQLVSEDIWVTVVDNRGTLDDHLLPYSVEYFDCVGWNVHQAWNHGILLARERKADWCCVLNDDLVLEPFGAHRIAELLKDRPDVWLAGFDYEEHSREVIREVGGSFREHGIGGFGFMIRPNVGLQYDERFNWWGGDDDLVWTCLARGGKAVVVEGVHMKHPDGGNTSGRHHPELMAGVGADRELLMEKWGKAW